jgi:hypothetical protein
VNPRLTTLPPELEREMTQVPRATRFPVVTRVLWRPHLGNEWSSAWSVNMSRSGVLFRFEDAPYEGPPAVGTRLDLIIGLSGETLPIDSADIQCSGRVARADRRDPGGLLIASTIDYYTFLKTQ